MFTIRALSLTTPVTTALASAVIATLFTLSPPALAQDGVVVWSGGIGVEERASAPKEGTKLVFFVASGNFLSGVTVVVKDSGGREVVNAVSKGPWMILNLPPGVYHVRANAGEEAQGGTINVDEGRSGEFAFMFRAQ